MAVRGGSTHSAEFSAFKEMEGLSIHQRPHTGQLRGNVDMLAMPALLRNSQRDQGAHRALSAGVAIKLRNGHPQRRSVWLPCQPHQSAHGGKHEVARLPMARCPSLQKGVIEVVTGCGLLGASPRGRDPSFPATPRVGLDDCVGPCQEIQKFGAPRWVVEVDHD